MSRLIDKLKFFNKNVGVFSDGHGIVTKEDRTWEKSYRQRWQHDKIVRSTHGVNCTGSCSWKIYVKGGLITWETQNTDYPRTRPDLPNHEPRGCQRGASFSWYVYSSARLKYPLIRSKLLRLWNNAKKSCSNSIDSWNLVLNESNSYKSVRGMGGFVRGSWDDVVEIIASANVYTIKKYGPDRIIGFSPIPAMSMVSYAAGSRYLSLIGGVSLSFYDWYCDLPPSSPQTWGEQTDVPESADWYNSNFLILWGSNVPQTRTPDAHFLSEVRYKGAKVVVVTPDYSEASKFADLWLYPKQGTDAALAMAMGHVILKEFYLNNEFKSEYFDNYSRMYTDMPFLVLLEKGKDGFIPNRFVRSSDFPIDFKKINNSEWKPLVFDKISEKIVIPNGTVGSRWGENSKWNLEMKNCTDEKEIYPEITFIDNNDDIISVAFPYFSGLDYNSLFFNNTQHENIFYRNIPVKKIKINNNLFHVATVFDLLVANYGIDRNIGGENIASSYNSDVPYTPFWQEKITGVKKEDVISVARQFADNANKTEGTSMVIIGAGMNHWYHMDMNYRSIMNLLIMCGCTGKSGGGWAHYVGQEKLRPQSGWLPLAFALDWCRPPRHMNGTSFFYNHTNQWRYEKVELKEILSPLCDVNYWEGLSIIDCNVRSERMGWLPTAPQLGVNPIDLCKQADDKGEPHIDYVLNSLKSGHLKMSCEDPDNELNFPRNMFIWRSNLLGSSGKGHEYFLKHLLGTQHGVMDDLSIDKIKPKEVVWHDNEVKGKLDLLVTLDFRLSTTCLYSDIVLPTASWYEKDDLNTSDMHPFIHPLSAAIDPVWETKTDWEIYKFIAKRFSEVANGFLGKVKDVVLVPLLHDTVTELGQSLEVKDWKLGECDLIPGKTMPNVVIVERDYLNTYRKFTSLGPLLDKMGNSGKGIVWDTSEEISDLGEINGLVLEEGVSFNRPKMDSAIDAAEVILRLAPETNGCVALKSWNSLSKTTGRDHSHLVLHKADEKISFRDLQSQPRKILTSPIWSGIESDKVSYNSGYINVHELIPWRTLTGRQQFYQDHKWMRDFGESLCVYKPPINTKTTSSFVKTIDEKYVILNFITPHQKWGIHSTYSDNLIMLTLNRGGPVVWISELDAAKVDLVDNDWIEAYNVNGSLAARAVVSQRVPEGMILMYHAQEKIVNVPVSEKTTYRGGIHNSVTRVLPKPTHMIGGYAQQSYGFNYYGTVGSNRDEFIILRKLKNVNFLTK